MGSEIVMPDIEEFGFQWHITNSCNQRCRHCYQDKFSNSSDFELHHLKRIADRIFLSLRNIPVTVNVTGGEPLLHRDLFPLLRHLATYNNLKELNLITNALEIDEAILRELKKNGALSAIKISLESHDSSINDSIRGKGHFEAVLNSIELLQSAGLQVVLMVTLGAWNWNSVSGLLQLARQKGVKGVIFERFVPLGNGLHIADGILNANHWLEIRKTIISENDLGISPEELLPYRAFFIDTQETENIGGEIGAALCNLGPQSMALMPDGTVYPCRRLPIPVGVLPSDSFPKVLKDLSKYSPLRLMPKLTKGGCGDCALLDCMGCRAQALSHSGTVYGDDPQCDKILKHEEKKFV
ncbi:radical SAM protein [Chitinispirillales bacterium ANBcel5]|uniref:radical SAM/SPASM domain-containing protein n=1 Tax=Cellulosispirillum alkaliphilum TaxID=3039283 RepID=UPI002A530221|nr:radical SAM protein [Chitinispirillales bacterium ANBcel5]